MTKFPDEQQNINLVVSAGLCTGCGMCEAVCPEQAIDMNFLEEGWFQAKIKKDVCKNCGLCLKVCGRNSENGYPENPVVQKNGENEYVVFLGRFKSCYTGYSTNIDIRWSAASGGLITSVLDYCFKTDIVNCAIIAGTSKENPLISQAIIVTDREDIVQNCGSRYAPIPMNSAIKEAMKISEKIAFLGLPCHLQSLEKAMKHMPEIRKSIVLRLGMFCSHNVSLRGSEFILKYKKLKKHDVLKFNYRGKGWPSGIRINTRDEKTVYVPNKNSIWSSLFTSFVYSTPYCLSCTDQTSELADISFGDAWLSDIIQRDKVGQSICISRTDVGSSVLDQALTAKVIKLDSIEPQKAIMSQSWPLYFKKFNILCRRKRYPEGAIKIDDVFKNNKVLMTDRFISWFACFSSSKSNRITQNNKVSHLISRLLIFIARPFIWLLHRRTESFISRYLIKKIEVPEQPESDVPVIKRQVKPIGSFHDGTNVVIINQHGSNRGDESALRGMLYGLKKQIPDAGFTVLTMTIAEDFQHIQEAEFYDTVTLLQKKYIKLFCFTFEALLYRFGFKRLTKLFSFKKQFMEPLKRADLVISAPGGPYLGDMYKKWESSCLFQIYISLLLRKHVMIYAPSQGPFDIEKRNKWRRWLISRVDVISLREKYSLSYLENLGIDTSCVHITSDSCLQKPVDKSLGVEILKTEKINTDKMLIGFVPLQSIPFLAEAESFDMQKKAKKTIELLADIFNPNFLLIPQLYGRCRDLPSIKQIARAVDLGKRIHVLKDTYDSDQQQSLIGRCDLFISFRYHPFIFATRQAVPSVCVAYEHKAIGFAQSIGMEEYCLDLFSATPEEIVKKAQLAWDNKEEFRKKKETGITRLEKLSMKNSELAAVLLEKHREK